MIKVLFIDDDPRAQNTLKMILSKDYSLSSAYTGQSGIEKVKEDDPDIVLLDIFLPDINGIEILKDIVALTCPPPVIMITESSDIQNVVRCVKIGAYDYIVKPYDLKVLENTIWRALQNKTLRKQSVSSFPEFDEIIGDSAQVKEVKKFISRFADSDSPILILGESGTGKELVAKAIHKVSYRNKGPFIPVNCGAIPETLIESELFGSEKGAFTGAVSKPGFFEKANNGTIFLDEIGEMSLSAQSRLLRVLQEKEITRVGSTKPIKLNIRILSATNKNLKEEVKKGCFREDLYYRFAVLVISLPALRERKDDIPILAAHFTKHFSNNKKTLSTDAIIKLKEHSWSGNIRELKNVLERAVLMADDNIIKPENITYI